MCLVLTPSVLARYFDHSFQVSLEHAEMVTDERREGKDLAWRRTGQADEAGHFVSLGKDHSFACIKFCFLLFLKLVPPVAFGGHALNILYAVCVEVTHTICELSIIVKCKFLFVLLHWWIHFSSFYFI